MVKIRQVDVSMLDKPKTASSPRAKQLTPAAAARLKQHRQFVRMLSKVNDRDAVFEIRMDKTEKAATIRQRLMKAATEAGKDVVVRKSEQGWLVGMATDDRRSKRGRRKSSDTSRAQA
jgi:hypothetical protein